jgi:uncharacterized protein (TIGR02246 family)
VGYLKTGGHMDATKIGKEIFNLETQYWNAMKEKDTETILSLTADPCIVTGAQGVMKYSKTDFTAMMKMPQHYSLEDFQIGSDYQVCVLNDDTAVIGYKVKETLTVQGKPVSLEAAQASTWIRKKGQWTCSLHSESITGDPFGRDRK